MFPSFYQLLMSPWAKGQLVCLGLDSEYVKIPSFLKNGQTVYQTMLSFNIEIIKETKDLVCGYKINTAFYEEQGAQGMKALKDTISFIHNVAPNLVVIVDGKRNDIGNTVSSYAKALFNTLGADAITINPYLGKDAVQGFLNYDTKGIIIIVKTSNPGSDEFQNLSVYPSGDPLYKIVAKNIASYWNEKNNCAVVVGANYPNELAEVRKIIGEIPILVPGIGFQTQGQDQNDIIREVIQNGHAQNSPGLIIHTARAAIFVSNGEDFAKKAREEIVKLNGYITEYL